GTLTREILARTKGRPNVRYGTISAAANGLANVHIGSTIVENATWLKSYAPIVGERVAVLASGSGWLILDAVERVQRAYNEPETVLAPVTDIALPSKFLWGESWDDDITTPGVTPKYPEPYTNPAWSALWPYSPAPD